MNRISKSSLDMQDRPRAFIEGALKWIALAYTAAVTLAVVLAWYVDVTEFNDPHDHLGADFIALLLTLPLSAVLHDMDLFRGPLKDLYAITLTAVLQVMLIWSGLTVFFKITRRHV